MPQQDVTQPDPQTIPPYEGRTTGSRHDEVGKALQGTIDRQLDETKTGRPGATSSAAMESPVRPGEVARDAAGDGDQPATDPTARSPLGVGASTTCCGEDVVEDDGQNGRQTTGTQGASQRPVGTSSSRDSTGIDPQEPDDGPTMPAGGSSAGS